MLEIISYQTQGPVAEIAFNRPDKMNAFNAQLLEEFDQALTLAERDTAVRVIIVKGLGRAFSVGMDISPKSHAPEEEGQTADRERLQASIERWLRVWDLPKPVIAQVHGYCCAAATTLALCCDITLVSEDCKIRFPSIPLGGGLVSSFWAFFVGSKKAKEMDFIAGSEMSGAEAHQWGWANHAIPSAELEDRARKMALLIARTPPDLLRLKKLAINRVAEWQGFRNGMLGGAEWDALSHFSDGAKEMRKRISDFGLSEAIKSLDKLN